MVADFTWIEANATAGDTSEPTNLNLGSTNATDLAPSTYPITAGTYSYSKWVRGNWSGTFTRVENLQFYASDTGPLVTGEIILVSASTGSYAGTDVWVGATDAADPFAIHAIADADPAAANVGFAGVLSASLEAAGSSDFIVVQASITGAASPGAVNQKTFTLQYDEV